jgi:hypothetical protein
MQTGEARVTRGTKTVIPLQSQSQKHVFFVRFVAKRDMSNRCAGPELKAKKQQSADESHAHIAFHTATGPYGPHVVRKATIVGNGVDDGKGDPRHWILHSGASEHFSPNRHLYKRYAHFKDPVNVQTAKGALDGVGIGSINVTVIDGLGNSKIVELKSVLHVPEMDSNLLSSNFLVDNSFEIKKRNTVPRKTA